MTAKRTHITLVGCGKMGAALLNGWLAARLDADYTVIEPDDIPVEFHNKQNIHHLLAANISVSKSSCIVLAVKPQILDDVCTGLREFIEPKTLVLSIAAGKSIANLESGLEESLPIIRSMPNTPASIGKGITVAVGNALATDKHKEFASELLACAGQVLWVDDESLLNAVTAVSGSGPAYVFYLIETMAKAGEAAGLAPDMAMTLARQTVIGSAALAEYNPATPATDLRKNVTSPNGTTQAALDVLMNGELDEIFKKAIAAATKRGEELNG